MNDASEARDETAGWVPPHGWVQLTPAGRFHLRQLGFICVLPFLLAPQLMWQANRLGAPLAPSITVGLAFVGVMLLLPMGVFRLRFPAAWVNLDSNELRSGRRVVPLDALSWARLNALPVYDFTRLSLEFGARRRARVSVKLHDHGEHIQTLAAAAPLAETLRRSSIAIPRSKDDPSDRLERVDHPTHLTKEDAVKVVLDPPQPGEPLPTEPWRSGIPRWGRATARRTGSPRS